MPLTSIQKSMDFPAFAAEMSTPLKSQTGYVKPASLTTRLAPLPAFSVGPPSTEAYRRTVGFQRHGTEVVVPGLSSTPEMFARDGVWAQTTWIGASMAVFGSGVTCSTRMRGSPPTRYAVGS